MEEYYHQRKRCPQSPNNHQSLLRNKELILKKNFVLINLDLRDSYRVWKVLLHFTTDNLNTNKYHLMHRVEEQSQRDKSLYSRLD